jgi:hypothetical protein
MARIAAASCARAGRAGVADLGPPVRVRLIGFPVSTFLSINAFNPRRMKPRAVEEPKPQCNPHARTGPGRIFRRASVVIFKAKKRLMKQKLGPPQILQIM